MPPEEEQADRSSAARSGLLEHTVGEPIAIGNEFAEVRLSRVDTRNGSRLLIESPKSGQWVALCPMEVEALTWQGTATFTAMIGHPFGSLVGDQPGESAPDSW
ncbi:MAG: hypothetical protein QOD39_5228 [Mycobacterium sp.]|jgi:hypothetical protein|nr:hypothetical protein [Mycobacterium sp.]